MPTMREEFWTCTVALMESSDELDSICNLAETSGTKSSNRLEILQNLCAIFCHQIHISLHKLS